MKDQAIKIIGVSKSYGAVKALDEVSFSVERGQVFGLIGPDGAGKTTLFRILCTLLLADQGHAEVDGFEVLAHYRSIRKRIGYMPGKFSLYPDLSVEENLSFFATLFGTSIQENYHLVEPIYRQLEPFKKRRAAQLSGGMKQKLALCCALIHKPSVLFLDEPTTGVDPVSRMEFWEMLMRLKTLGITMLVSTPYMDEAGQCDRIALIQKGRIMAQDSPSGIVNAYGASLWAIWGPQMPELLRRLRACPSVASAHGFGDTHHVSLKPQTQIDAVEAFLKAQQLDYDIRPIAPNIEDCYMKLAQ